MGHFDDLLIQEFRVTGPGGYVPNLFARLYLVFFGYATCTATTDIYCFGTVRQNKLCFSLVLSEIQSHLSKWPKLRT